MAGSEELLELTENINVTWNHWFEFTKRHRRRLYTIRSLNLGESSRSRFSSIVLTYIRAPILTAWTGSGVERQ
jgi:hypothetical protein